MRRFMIALLLTLALSPALAHADTHFTRTQTRRTVERAGHYYRLNHKEIRWLKWAAVAIIYTGAAESHGHTRTDYNGCRGILQFDGGWHSTKGIRKRARRWHHKHHAGDWRYCGTCSIYRFTKVYHDGGKAAIARHWAATLYR